MSLVLAAARARGVLAARLGACRLPQHYAALHSWAAAAPRRAARRAPHSLPAAAAEAAPGAEPAPVARAAGFKDLGIDHRLVVSGCGPPLPPPAAAATACWPLTRRRCPLPLFPPAAAALPGGAGHSRAHRGAGCRHSSHPGRRERGRALLHRLGCASRMTAVRSRRLRQQRAGTVHTQPGGAARCSHAQRTCLPTACVPMPLPYAACRRQDSCVPAARPQPGGGACRGGVGGSHAQDQGAGRLRAGKG